MLGLLLGLVPCLIRLFGEFLSLYLLWPLHGQSEGVPSVVRSTT